VLLAWLALPVLPPRAAAAGEDAPFSVFLRVVYGGLGMEDTPVDLIFGEEIVVSTRTDATGAVEFHGITSERFEVLVRRSGYFPRRVIWFNFARRDIHDVITLKKRVRWTLSGTVRGSGLLLEGARVTLLAGGDSVEEATTGAGGAFAFSHVFDTECRFSVEKPGFHRKVVWLANRPQRDLHFDVLMLPREGPPPAVTRWGDPDLSVHLRTRAGPVPGTRPLEVDLTAEQALARLAEPAFGEPQRDGGRSARAITGGLALARLTSPFGRLPEGALTRADRILSAWTRRYPRGTASRPSTPLDAGTTGWDRSRRRRGR
jgi:hypothetical protein